MNRILAPIALAGALAAAAITTSPQSASAATAALSDGTTDGGCGSGSKVECGSTTTYKCTSWMPQYSISATGISITYVCASSITQTSKSYKD